MSGRGDDKSIEPAAHQSLLSGGLRRASLEDMNMVARTKQAAEKLAEELLAALEARLEQAKAEAPAALTELERRDDERVRRIAEEVAVKVQARPLEALNASVRHPASSSETGWAIMDYAGLLLAVDGIFRSDLKPHEVRRLDREPVSEYTMDAHASGSAAVRRACGGTRQGNSEGCDVTTYTVSVRGSDAGRATLGKRSWKT